MATAPEFSVVIPTHNRLLVLEEVLLALEGQAGAPPFEVVVVDDGSTDGTGDWLRARTAKNPRVTLRIHSQANAGPAAARNTGVAIAAGRWVAFLGDDTVPEAGWLAAHREAHRKRGDDPHLAVIGYTGWHPRMHLTPFLRYINEYGLQFGYALIQDREDVPFNFFYTSNISISTSLMATHPFDTTFPAAAWEDIELAYRLDKLGLKIRYDAKAVTRHYHPMTVESFARRQYTVGKSGAIFFRKHPELGHFLGAHDPTPVANDAEMARLTKRAQWGERLRWLARKDVFEKLMRQHYLRGLREGLQGC